MVFIVKIPNYNRSRQATPEPNPPPRVNAAATSSLHAASLDILLAPQVLNHRYVRGVDKSLIVERPGRIRAVLLGIAGAIGKCTSNPCLASDNQVDADDLATRLSSLAVHDDNDGNDKKQDARPSFQVLYSTAALSLDPPHPSVAFVHAHSKEAVESLESTYEQARQKRKHGKQVADQTELQATTASAFSNQQKHLSHASYLAYLCSKAPSHPPLSQVTKLKQDSSPSFSTVDTSTAAEESKEYTSSDGEGDDTIHLSEVPDHLPQGDLYLAGATDDKDQGGSSDAIRHAIGACSEAVDRVVAAVKAERNEPTPSTLYSQLDEISYHPSVFDSDSSSAQVSETDPTVSRPPSKRTFVLCRPPGHHCAGSTPSGFCWVNNAIVAAAHGYLCHSIDRVVIFDIDLHHGNGTQSLVWRINADSQKHDLERESRLASLRASAIERTKAALRAAPRVGPASARNMAAAANMVDEEHLEKQAGPRGLRIFYSSIHDIESFPCEDGDPTLIKDASVCIEGAHGQWIWNVHLEQFNNEAEFNELYLNRYSAVFSKAERFLGATAAKPETTLVLISAGFDACLYEYPGMQRHGKHVPPSFYDRFARDSVKFADRWSQGKLVSVLEGGYSDRALCSAAMSHVIGLSAGTSFPDMHAPWKLDNLVQLEKMAKRMAATAVKQADKGTPAKRRVVEPSPWLAVASRAFAAFERKCGKTTILPINHPATLATTVGGGGGDSGENKNSPSVTSDRVLRNRNALKAKPTWDPSSPTPTAASRSIPSVGEKSETGIAEMTSTIASRFSLSDTIPSHVVPPLMLPKDDVQDDTTSQIGSVTPKTEGIQTTPVMLVDAMDDGLLTVTNNVETQEPDETVKVAEGGSKTSSLGLLINEGQIDDTDCFHKAVEAVSLTDSFSFATTPEPKYAGH